MSELEGEESKVMASLFRKERRIVYARKISGFWEEFRVKKIGLFGLAILIFYVVLAISAPLLTPYDPIVKERVAQDFAMPGWVTALPQFADYPTTKDYLLYWNREQELGFIKSWGKAVDVEYQATTMETIDVELSTTFSYNDIPPNAFYFKFEWKATDIVSTKY